MAIHITPPLLQRLSKEPPLPHDTSLVIKSIRTNIENILNTRNLQLITEDDADLIHSNLNYGLDDLMHLYITNPTSQSELCRRIKQQIYFFEQRITQVDVSILTIDTTWQHILPIQLQAILPIRNDRVTLLFDTNLHMTNYHFELLP
jgi:type VI secretion system lysozyme-like protein